MVWLSAYRAAKSFITTPIFYVNAAPHIGHLYSAVLADAAHRWEKITRLAEGDPAILSTGTDEHGLKVQQAAQAAGLSPKTFCDGISEQFKALFDQANVSYTHFIRTTDARHTELVQHCWRSLDSKGLIYKGMYEGWYCLSDEMFLSEHQITDEHGIKVSIESGNEVEWSSEENYMFALSAYHDHLLHWVDSAHSPIIPESARLQVRSWLTVDQLKDLSVSRPSSRLSWGVAVPGDPSQTIYVWLDALVNYLTVSAFPDPTHCWPASAHIVGKDILRFHAVYWPAFLLALGLDLPERIVSHSHWTVERKKMSKSRGNVVNPFDLLTEYGVEPVRYFLLKDSNLCHDGDYSDERVRHLLVNDLADNLGNLLMRVTSQRLSPPGIRLTVDCDALPLAGGRALQEDRDLLETLQELPHIVGVAYDSYEFNVGLEAVMSCLQKTNRFVDRHKPWLLVPHPQQHPLLGSVLTVAMESLRLCSCLLYPVLPSTSSELLARLGLSSDVSKGSLQCWLSEKRVESWQQFSPAHSQMLLFTKPGQGRDQSEQRLSSR